MSAPVDGLRMMIAQAQEIAERGYYLPALMTALALPDICGALGSENGRASGAKARAWMEAWVPSAGQNAAAIYKLRCSLLHQGSGVPEDGGPRVAFFLSGEGYVGLHGPAAVFESAAGERMTPITVDTFVDEIADGVDRWLAAHGTSSVVERNMTRFAHLRQNGLPGFIVGQPVIA